MNLAAIDWLSISINLLLVVFVIVCLLMTLLILMQRPKQEGLGAAFGAGVTDQVFGARTTNVLQRGTVYLGSLFFILSLALAVLIGHKNKKISMLAANNPVSKVETTTPAEPKKETEPPKSLSEELPKETPPAKEVTPTPPAETPPAKEVAPTPPAETTPAKEETPTPPAETTPAKEETPPPPAEPAPAKEAPAGTPAEKSGEP